MIDDFDRHLEDALLAHADPDTTGAPVNLVEAMRYSLLLPGKRIRPRLTLATSEMVGLSPAAALPAAMALEMIHCFTLIHDDLPCMDNADTRRGQPSCHKKFGEALALLAGDGLMALGFKTFFSTAPHVQPMGFSAAVNRFADAVGPVGVTGGQAMEMLIKPKDGLAPLRLMHAAKTGALFKAALLVPKDLAEVAAEGDGGQSIIAFADALGSAFQVADDLEDAAHETAKERGNNIFAHGKREDILASARADLDSTTRHLEEIWGAPSAGVLAIAAEVSARLKG
ncbi:MAG TPA: polyprenyl synthetase family protein [Bdellovibrionota bacterium]|nr:polyprenyl synthetase family protein [Bdellovibrionota bacterium]